MASALEQLPAVHEVLLKLEGVRAPHELVVKVARRVLDQVRRRLRNGEISAVPDVAEMVRTELNRISASSLRRVINATGVILHTNLGRAPLPSAAVPAGYTNLEYDLARGQRGRRDVHVGGLLEELLGYPGIAVNNNAAAVYLALNELAAGGEVIVSRGELIEIGDGFRIPDIMARAGAVLREVGTTNRTRIEDYRSAITPATRMLMAVHASNFRIEGFTGKPSRADLAGLAREAKLVFYEDLGSGCLADLAGYGVTEPRPRESLHGGVTLVSFSGDKLLGGPQAGILGGHAEVVARLRRNPMYRALRLDKVILSLLEDTLRRTLFERWDEIPALGMIRMPAEEVRRRASAFVRSLDCAGAGIVEGESLIGGGSAPEQKLPTWLVAIRAPHPGAVEQRLRESDPPVVARVEEERLLIDLRTVFVEEEQPLAQALRMALRS